MGRERSFGERIAIGIAGGLVACALAYFWRPRPKASPPSKSGALVTLWGRFELSPDGSQLTVRSRDGRLNRSLGLQLVVDDAPHPLEIAPEDRSREADSLRAKIHVALGD